VLTDPAVKPFGTTVKKASKKWSKQIFYILLVVQEGVNCRVQSAMFSGPKYVMFKILGFSQFWKFCPLTEWSAVRIGILRACRRGDWYFAVVIGILDALDPAVEPFGATVKKTSKKVVEAIFIFCR
jgi:hypothetical protein